MWLPRSRWGKNACFDSKELPTREITHIVLIRATDWQKKCHLKLNFRDSGLDAISYMEFHLRLGSNMLTFDISMYRISRLDSCYLKPLFDMNCMFK